MPNKEPVFCPFCSLHCKTGELTLTQAPKDLDYKVPGITAEGVAVESLKPFCIAHFTPFGG